MKSVLRKKNSKTELNQSFFNEFSNWSVTCGLPVSMRPFLLWGMSARVEWRGANAVPPAYRPTFYRCKRLTHLPQGPARVFWRSVYRSDLSKEATWSRKQEVPALDEIFDNPGLTPLMNLPRRVRFKDFINYSDEKAIFVGLNFAIVSLFFSPWRSSNIMFISWSLLVINMSLFGHFGCYSQGFSHS